MKNPMRSLIALALFVSLAASTATGPSVAHATAPGRNGRIAFMADTGDGNQIFTIRANGHDVRQVTQVDGDAALPDWSPDGRRIAFALDECNVAIVDADGSDLTVIPKAEPNADNACEGDPSFTPDGSRLVFERYDGVLDDDAVWSMDLDGSDRVRISGAGAPDPNVSPDGASVTFLGGPSELKNRLLMADIDGGAATPVTPALYGIAFKHDWAPDGEHLVFTDNANDLDHPANIATIRPDGTGLRYLTDLRSPDQRAYVGSYSPDGNWIVFRLEDGDRFALYRMRPDGRAMHAILPFSEFKPRHIDWGPATVG